MNIVFGNYGNYRNHACVNHKIKYFIAIAVIAIHILPFVVSFLSSAFFNHHNHLISVSFAPSVASVFMKAGQKSVVTNKDTQKYNKFKDKSSEQSTSTTNQLNKTGENDTDSNASSFVEYNIGSHNNPTPQYPAFARQNGYQGSVNICVDVNTDGKAISAKVCKSSGYQILDLAALNAVKKWQFTINKTGGALFENYASIIVPINFVLN